MRGNGSTNYRVLDVSGVGAGWVWMLGGAQAPPWFIVDLSHSAPVSWWNLREFMNIRTMAVAFSQESLPFDLNALYSCLTRYSPAPVVRKSALTQLSVAPVL